MENVIAQGAREKNLSIPDYIAYMVGMHGSMAAAARALNISRQRLYQIMASEGIEPRRTVNIVRK